MSAELVHVACPGCHVFRPAVLDPVTGRTVLDRHTAGRGSRRPCRDWSANSPWVVLLDPRPSRKAR